MMTKLLRQLSHGVTLVQYETGRVGMMRNGQRWTARNWADEKAAMAFFDSQPDYIEKTLQYLADRDERIAAYRQPG
jgi:hypothetical protein